MPWSAPRTGRRLGCALHALSQGLSERPRFDALFFRGVDMAQPSESADAILASAPKLPLDDAHWEAVVSEMGLSDQQARVVELVLRDLCDKQIAAVMGISKSTLDTYMHRIRTRTGTRGRIQLAMHVMAVSFRVRP